MNKAALRLLIGILSAVIVIVFSMSIVLVALMPKNPAGDDDDGLVMLQDYTIPKDLAAYGLTIEWVNQSGAQTAFNPKKPVVILFDGAVDAEYKSSYSLDTDIYYYRSADEHSIADNSKDMKPYLSHYWYYAGYNVGIFHYENYAQGELGEIVKKIYSARNVSYTNNAGETIYSAESFNLTEVFVYLWLELLAATPLEDTDTPFTCQDVRFIGNTVGANLAVSAADFLYLAYEKGLIPAYAVPNRVAMINPWLSNDASALSVDFRKEAYVSALAYNAQIVSLLAEKGVVFELIEDDADYYLSYNTPYSGLTGEEGNYTLGTGGDSALFRTVLANAATLWLNQTYQNYYTPEYLAMDRAALDWYLYSINGSDDPSLEGSSYGGSETYPMADDITNYLSGRLYGVSAWTPTSYLRAVRGVQYRMLTKSYNNETSLYDDVNPYTMIRFQAEAKQCSDLSKSYVCGYVYKNKNNSRFINWSGDTHLEGIKVTLLLEQSDSQGATKQFTTYSGKDGFYSFELDSKYYESTMTLSVNTGKYAFAGQRDIKESFYQQYSTSTVNDASLNLDQSYMEKGSKLFQIIFKNCGLRSLS